ncbi:MAG: ABC transporter ATP-binding protein [Bacteroidaceae bacterium]|nr:ABC transporter ATP-binding protein [Bacteroidaceae bacterium]
MIEVRNLTKKYRELTVIDDFSHCFDAGKVYGVMGENGAGKSTLFRCMAGLETYDGTVIVSENSQIGYMNDTPFYYSYVNGMEHIEFCLRAKGKNVSRDVINKLNEKFALPLNRYASRYSLGMKKRLMLLTLMLQDNDIVIMDEPFNGIDLAGAIVLRQWLKEMKAEGRCVILSSHIVSAISDICDEITYIHKGKVVADLSGMSAESIEKYILDKIDN